MKTKRILVVVVISLVFIVGLVGYKMYNKPHKNVVDATPELTITAANLISKFEVEKDEISKELLDQIIEVSGTVTTVEKNDEGLIVILDNGVKCELKKDSKVEKGQKIIFRGIYTGFDEMFNEISFVRCVLIK